MSDENTIIVVNGPILQEHAFGSNSSGLIYSVSLSNGMVVTSPEGFELTSVNGKNKPQPPIQELQTTP